MTDIENAALLLRRKISEKEMAGGIGTNEAVRLTEVLQEIESLLIKE